MGTGLDSATTGMDRKIPSALWKTQLLKLVSEAPRAVCVNCRNDWSHSLSPDEEIGTQPLVLLSSSSGSTTSTTSSDNFQRLMGNTNSSDEKLDCGGLRDPPDLRLGGFSGTGSSYSITRRAVETNGRCYQADQMASWEHRSLIDLGEENPFGKAFHGYLSPSQTSQLLQKDGQFLVRKKDPSDDDFILSFRFGGQMKNFILSCDESTGSLYVGEKEKSYATLQELVQEGLITLYLDQKAGSYIDLMCDLTRFHKMSTKTSLGCGGVANNGSNQSLSKSNNAHSYSGSGRFRKNSTSPSPTVASTLSRSSVERRKNLDLKSHSFHLHTFEGLSTCRICQNFLWGLSSQGLQCKDCGFSVHESCVEKVISDCEPRLESLNRIFEEDLTLLVKAAKGNPPFVLVKCITEIENRGLGVEGIYRVSGSKELIDRLKMLFEKERSSTDLSAHLDIHSMCCLVKLFLRLLPQPLVSAEVFQKFLTTRAPLTIDMLRRYMLKLPLSHQVTLKYVLQHLYRVSQNSDRNKMTPFNLSSVFTPSIICPMEISLTTLKVGTNVLEQLILNVPIIYPLPQTTHLRVGS